MPTGTRNFHRFGVIAALAVTLGACSFERMTANIVANAITGGGGVYGADDDPELIQAAIPFGLKTYESLLEISPEHRGLLLASARGFAAYAYMLQTRADRLDEKDVVGARELRRRAARLFIRGRDYALRGLATAHPGFEAALRRDRAAALAVTTTDDVAFLYWAGAAWAGALSANKGDLGLIAELPVAGALVERVLALDEGFDMGAAHEFLIAYEGGRPGGSAEKARRHYRRAVALSRGAKASPHVALAEAVAIAKQDVAEFRALIAKALAVDPDRSAENRLANTMAQRRARWLLSRIPDLFLIDENEEKRS